MQCTHFPLIYSVDGMTLQINCHQFVLIMASDLKMQMHPALSQSFWGEMIAVALNASRLSLISNRANKCTQILISSPSGTTFSVFFPSESLSAVGIFLLGFLGIHRILIRFFGHMSCCVQCSGRGLK